MLWTRVANLNCLVGHSMLSVCGTGVDTVHMVYATAHGECLDDSDAHCDVEDLV
jgi:hypothetical protein